MIAVIIDMKTVRFAYNWKRAAKFALLFSPIVAAAWCFVPERLSAYSAGGISAAVAIAVIVLGSRFPLWNLPVGQWEDNYFHIIGVPRQTALGVLVECRITMIVQCRAVGTIMPANRGRCYRTVFPTWLAAMIVQHGLKFEKTGFTFRPEGKSKDGGLWVKACTADEPILFWPTSVEDPAEGDAPWREV